MQIQTDLDVACNPQAQLGFNRPDDRFDVAENDFRVENRQIVQQIFHREVPQQVVIKLLDLVRTHEFVKQLGDLLNVLLFDQLFQRDKFHTLDLRIHRADNEQNVVFVKHRSLRTHRLDTVVFIRKHRDVLPCRQTLFQQLLDLLRRAEAALADRQDRVGLLAVADDQVAVLVAVGRFLQDRFDPFSLHDHASDIQRQLGRDVVNDADIDIL